MKITNVGNATAQNVKLFVRAGGLAEITKDGVLTRELRTDGWLDLEAIEPASKCQATIWTAYYLDSDDVRIISDGRVVVVQPEYVSRESNRWVVGFGWLQVIFVGWLVFIVMVIAIPVAISLKNYSSSGRYR